MSEVEEVALRVADILLKALTSLGKNKPTVKPLSLFPYHGPTEGQVYYEEQKKANTSFLPWKNNYPGFRRLNHIEQHTLTLYLNTRVGRFFFCLYLTDFLYYPVVNKYMCNNILSCVL